SAGTSSRYLSNRARFTNFLPQRLRVPCPAHVSQLRPASRITIQGRNMHNRNFVALATAMAIAATPVFAAGQVLQDGDPQAAGFSPEGIAKLNTMLDGTVANGDVAGIETMLV